MVDQDLQASPNKNKHFIIKLFGFFLSTAIIYFMVIWTIELSKVEIEDLPVISVLNDNFKISAKNSHSDIQNLGLLFLKTKKFYIFYYFYYQATLLF